MDTGVDAVAVPSPLVLLGEPAGHFSVTVRLDDPAVIGVVVGMGQEGDCGFVVFVKLHQPVKVHIEDQISVDENDIVGDLALQIILNHYRLKPIGSAGC